jgi:hypothetical protein
MTFDPDLAARSVAELAAVTDAELVIDVRAGIDEVLMAWQAWRSDPGYPARGTPGRSASDNTGELITTTVKLVEALPGDADLATLVAAIRPLLGAFIPPSYGLTEIAAAVDRLREPAITRPGLCAKRGRWPVRPASTQPNSGHSGRRSRRCRGAATISSAGAGNASDRRAHPRGPERGL